MKMKYYHITIITTQGAGEGGGGILVMMHDVMNSRRASERMEAVSWGLYKKKKRKLLWELRCGWESAPLAIVECN